MKKIKEDNMTNSSLISSELNQSQTLSKEKTAAILISRQPLRTSLKSPWLEAARKAVIWSGKNGYTLITSAGVKTWEMLLYLAARYSVSFKTMLIAFNEREYREKCEWVRTQFRLKEYSSFVPVICTEKKSAGHLRDRIIAEAADTLIPVSVRSGGNIRSLLDKIEKSGKPVESRFEIPYRKRDEKIKYSLTNEIAGIKLQDTLDPYLIHWTRTSEGPWPGEILADYYEAILNSESYPRDAFSTLKKILSEGVITASSRHMPSGIRTVSFTGATLEEFVPLMRWRARYREMSFEPYGIGLEKQTALQRGIHEVIYDECPEKTGSQKRWIYQSTGKMGLWTVEKEYRCRGDFSLREIQPEKIICFCFKRDEAEEIERKFKVKAVSFC
jgi:hypothetical protein